jgi:hypothetical protein
MGFASRMFRSVTVRLVLVHRSERKALGHIVSI